VSVGEVLIALKFIREMKNRDPHLPVAFSDDHFDRFRTGKPGERRKLSKQSTTRLIFLIRGVPFA
jgi:hypothetical protein